MTLTQLLRAVKERLEAATQQNAGRWECAFSTDQRRGSIFIDGRAHIASYNPDDVIGVGKEQMVANYKLIAHAPTDLAKLARICEVQREALERLDRDDGWNNVGDCVDIAREARAKADAIAAEGGEG